jgi:hypothetical protein
MASNESTLAKPQAQVTILRTSPRDNQRRVMIAKLDGAPFATLYYGKSATRAIEPGTHTLHVDNTFARKTQRFEIGAGGHVTFQLINRSGRFTWMLVALLGAGPMYISIEPVD